MIDKPYELKMMFANVVDHLLSHQLREHKEGTLLQGEAAVEDRRLIKDAAALLKTTFEETFDSMILELMKQDQFDFNRYGKEAISFSSDYEIDTDPIERLNDVALGMAGEGGETADIVKKIKYQGHALDDDKIAKIANELGDILWYVNKGSIAIGYSLIVIAAMNLEKLRGRYKSGKFSVEESINRLEEELPKEWTDEMKEGALELSAYSQEELEARIKEPLLNPEKFSVEESVNRSEELPKLFSPEEIIQGVQEFKKNSEAVPLHEWNENELTWKPVTNPDDFALADAYAGFEQPKFATEYEGNFVKQEDLMEETLPKRIKQLYDTNNGTLPDNYKGEPIYYIDGTGRTLCSICSNLALETTSEAEDFKPKDYYINYGFVDRCFSCGKKIATVWRDKDAKPTISRGGDNYETVKLRLKDVSSDDWYDVELREVDFSKPIETMDDVNFGEAIYFLNMQGDTGSEVPDSMMNDEANERIILNAVKAYQARRNEK